MSKRQKDWARRARVALIEELGGKCAWCASTDELTFDCIMPQDHTHHRFDTSQRMSFYGRQHIEHGNVQVLCHSCNSRKSIIEQDLADVALTQDFAGRIALLNKIARTILRRTGKVAS